jgi:hypothetical protein
VREVIGDRASDDAASDDDDARTARAEVERVKTCRASIVRRRYGIYVSMGRRAGAAIMFVASAAALAAACGAFSEGAGPEPVADAGVEAWTDDWPHADSGTDGPHTPYCNGDATFCADFPRAPATLTWDAVDNPTLGSFVWSPSSAPTSQERSS